MSFYRLICSIYFTKHCTAFLPYSNPEALFDSFSAEDVHDRHILFVTEIRERQWERVVSEVEMMPNPEALNLHWKRCCWVFQYWSQCKQNLVTFGDLSDFGWNISNDKLIIVWDIDLNFQKVERTVQWYTKGCGCKTGCMTNRCKYRKGRGEGFCGPGCKCINCLNLPSSKQGPLNFSFECEDTDDDFEIFDDLDDIQEVDITDIITDEQTDRQVDADDYWMYSDEDL
jgi:hypothetical protein